MKLVKKIVEISKKLISYNKDRVPKEMKSGAKGNAYVALLPRKDTLSIFETVLNQVHKLIDSGKCRNVALIGRKQVSLFPYQILLSAEKERYNVDADLDIFDGDAMQALQRIIQIVYRAKQNDNDDPIEDMLTIIDRIDRYKLQAKERGDLQQHLMNAGVTSMEEAMAALRDYLNPIKKMDSCDICNIMQRLLAADSVYDLMKVQQRLYKSGYGYSLQGAAVLQAN